MSWHLDEPMVISGTVVGAITSSESQGTRLVRGRTMRAGKRPLVVLIRTNTELHAFDTSGRAVTVARVEKDFPGALSAFNDWVQANSPEGQS